MSFLRDLQVVDEAKKSGTNSRATTRTATVVESSGTLKSGRD